VASKSNPEIAKKGPATPPVPWFMARCACVRVRRGRGRLRARKKAGDYNNTATTTKPLRTVHYFDATPVDCTWPTPSTIVHRRSCKMTVALIDKL